MHKKNPSRSTDLKQILSEKLTVYHTLFSAPIPPIPEKDPDPQTHYQSLTELFHSKGKKLIEIASTYQQLSETYYKNMKSLESYKESSEYQFEKLEIRIEQSENSLKSQTKTIENLNSYIEEVEKHLLEASKQRDSYKESLQSAKKYLKDLEQLLEKTKAQSQALDQKRLEEDLKKIESFKSEVLIKERLIEDLQQAAFSSEKSYEKEKEISEKLRLNCEKLRSEVFELKNQLSEEKLKKSNYKDLYKEILEERSAKCRNSVQTVDEVNSEEGLEQEQGNDLFELEQDHSIASSLDLRESCILNSQSDHVFYLVAKGSLNIEKMMAVEIRSNKKALSIDRYFIEILPVNCSHFEVRSGVRVEDKVNSLEILQSAQLKQTLAVSANSGPLTGKNKDSCKDAKINAPVIEVSQDSEEIIQETSQKKGLIASFCLGVRYSISKPVGLINRFSKLKNMALPNGFPG